MCAELLGHLQEGYAVAGAAAGDCHDLDFGVLGTQLLDSLDAFLSRHQDVRDHDIGGEVGQQRQAAAPFDSGLYLVPLLDSPTAVAGRPHCRR